MAGHGGAAGVVVREASRWAAAGTRVELCALTVAWLTGQIAWQPGYAGPVDVDEHLAPGLTAGLVACNRAGFLTRQSQAGLDGYSAGGVRCQQVAWVSGFADGWLAGYLLDVGAAAGLEVHVWGRESVPRVVTVENLQPATVDGPMSRRTVRRSLAGAGRRAVAEVLAGAQISVVDPVPGRNTLWAWLTTVLAGPQTDTDAATAAGKGA
jgi:hypothetical protein